jgi:hypothetical protein
VNFRPPHFDLIAPGKEWVSLKSSLFNTETEIAFGEFEFWHLKQSSPGPGTAHFIGIQIGRLFFCLWKNCERVSAQSLISHIHAQKIVRKSNISRKGDDLDLAEQPKNCGPDLHPHDANPRHSRCLFFISPARDQSYYAKYGPSSLTGSFNSPFDGNWSRWQTHSESTGWNSRQIRNQLMRAQFRDLFLLAPRSG